MSVEMTSRSLTSSATSRWRQEARAIATLALPLSLTQLAYMAIVATDVIMMGWLGSEYLAAGSLAGHYIWFFEYFAFGLLAAIAPILSHHIGARNFRLIRRTVRQGFWMAVIVVIPCAAMVWQSGVRAGDAGPGS